mgnify:CR=1 FL=1
MDKKFINWRVIMQSLLGKSTGVDDEQVEEWLHEDARNQEYYEKAKYYFDNYYSGEKEIHQINMKKAWDDFLVYTKKSRNNIWKRYLQYVAGVVMLLGVGVALLLLVGKSEKPSTVVQNQMMGMDLAFKALVNDLYSKDLSGKVISSLHSKKERGIYCSANCPFGYRKKADDKNQVEIVPEEAKVIREIFRLTLEGYSSVDIAKKFHKEKIKTPVEYLAARGVTHRNPLGKEFSWHHTTICKILRNDFYAGDVVYGKYEKDAVGGKNHLKPKSEWKITYHHHEPIIEREIFEEVQRTRGISKPYQPRKAHMLTGKVLCGECGRALCYRNAKHPYFYCKDRYTTGNENCLKKVNIFLLEQMLVSALQKEICRQIELKEVWKLYQEVQKRQYDAKMAKLRKARKNLEITGKEQIILYERYKKKEILKEEYLACKEKVQKKEDAIKSEIQRQKMLLVEMEAEKHTGLPDADKIWKACKVHELNQETVDSFIRKVKVWDERHVEIIWNFSDGKAT